MQEFELEEDAGRPVVLYLVVGVLAVIGAFTLLGFVIGALGFLFKLAVLAIVVFAALTIIRMAASRR